MATMQKELTTYYHLLCCWEIFHYYLPIYDLRVGMNVRCILELGLYD